MSTLPVDIRVRVDDGVTLRVRDHRPHRAVADPRTFLLVHGLASNALLWDGVARALAQAGDRSIAVDLRSHGRSDPSDDLSFARIVSDLVQVVETLALDRPFAVGQSWGGNVVLELGTARPDRIAGVVGVDGGLIDLAGRFADIEGCWDALAPPALDGTRWADLEAHVRTRTRGWPAGSAEAQLANLVPTDDGTVRSILTRSRHRSIIEHLYAQRPFERLTALEVPMLLLAVTDTDRRVLDEERLGGARERSGAPLRIVRLPGRDHDVHLQDPDLVAGLIGDWASGGTVPDTVGPVGSGTTDAR